MPALLLLALVPALVPEAAAGSCLGSMPQNVVVLLTDDMRFDGLWAMPLTAARLAPHGVALDRAYVTTPMCCPDRSSMLSGGYLPTHVGVLSNELPNGGALRFDDTHGLALRLQQEGGWATGLVGKYLNKYEDLAPHVPPGWTAFAGWYDPQPWTGFDLVEGSTTTEAAVGTHVHYTGYVTDEQAAWATSFIDAHAAEPFLLYLSFLAPHHPHTPAPQDRDSFSDYLFRERGYTESDLSDKPAWMRALPPWDADEVAEADDNNRERLQSLQAVDRAVVAVLDELDAQGLTDHTLVVFTSDNGEQWGEHRLSQKGVPYEESVRVPLIVSHPALTPGTRDALVAANLDIGATIQDLAGIALRTDGQSLVPLLCDATTPTRDDLVLQGWTEGYPFWASVVTEQYKYTEWTAGDTELYDLTADPFELDSRHADPALDDVRAGLADTLHAGRGLSIAEDALPDAQVGVPYDHTVPLWGGTPPFQWTLTYGTLPDGLSFGADGRVTGTPTREDDEEIRLQVVDSSVSPYNGAPASLIRTVDIDVGPAPAVVADPSTRCGCGSSGGAALLWIGALGLSTRARSVRRR